MLQLTEQLRTLVSKWVNMRRFTETIKTWQAIIAVLIALGGIVVHGTLLLAKIDSTAKDILRLQYDKEAAHARLDKADEMLRFDHTELRKSYVEIHDSLIVVTNQLGELKRYIERTIK